MSRRSRLVPSVAARCLLVWGAATLGAGAVSVLLLPMTPGLAADDFAGVLTSVCAVAVLLCSGWAWIVTGVVVIEALGAQRRDRAADQPWDRPVTGPIPGIPVWTRRLVLAACGVAVAVGVTGPVGAAGATDAVAPDSSGTGSIWSRAALEAVHPPATDVGLDGLPMPDRPSDRAPVPHAPLPRTPGPSVDTAPSERHTVLPGDTLWDIAERRLGMQADEAHVAAYVARLHALNRPVVGVDPDLICPGQQLRLPPIH